MPTAIGGPVPKLESRIEVSAGRIAIPVAGGLEIGADIWWWGVFGREGYNLQGNDNRNTGELIRGPLDGGSFGGVLLAGKYASLRTIDTYLKAIPGAGDMSAAEKAASAGFGKTLKVYQLFRAIVLDAGHVSQVQPGAPRQDSGLSSLDGGMRQPLLYRGRVGPERIVRHDERIAR